MEMKLSFLIPMSSQPSAEQWPAGSTEMCFPLFFCKKFPEGEIFPQKVII